MKAARSGLAAARDGKGGDINGAIAEAMSRELSTKMPAAAPMSCEQRRSGEHETEHEHKI
jgi:hypothetical protein